MRGAVLYGPRDVRFEELESPKIVEPTDAIIRISRTCVCGSDLWPYRGLQPINGPAPMGHEYCGIVEEIGSAVRSVKRGQFVIGSFFASDNTCPNCHNRLPVVLPASGICRRCSSAIPTCSLGGRHSRRNPRRSFLRPPSEHADRVGRHGNRMVRG